MTHVRDIDPELATLSAMVHGTTPDRREVFDALLSGVASVDDERAKLYIDIVCAVLPQIAKQELEEMMVSGTREYKSDFARKYVAEGRADGKAEGQGRGRGDGDHQGTRGTRHLRPRRRAGARHRMQRRRPARTLDHPRGDGRLGRRAVRLK